MRSAFLCALLLLPGCASSRVRKTLSRAGVVKIAVLPFTDSPGAPGSGRLAADSLRNELARRGFVVCSPADAESVLSGEVTKAVLRREMAPSTLEEEQRVRTDGPSPELERIPVIVRHDDVRLAVFALQARLVKTSDGALLWSGAASESDEDGSLAAASQRAALSAASAVLRTLLGPRP